MVKFAEQYAACCILSCAAVPQFPACTRVASAAEVSSRHQVSGCAQGQHAMTTCLCDSSSGSATPFCSALIIGKTLQYLQECYAGDDSRY